MPNQRPLSELFDRARGGDGVAVHDFISRVSPLLLRAIGRRLSTSARRLRSLFDASDFLQECLLSAFTAALRFDEGSTNEGLSAFLVTMAVNKVRDAERKYLERPSYNLYREVSLGSLPGENFLLFPARQPSAEDCAEAEDLWGLILGGIARPDRAVLIMLRRGYTHNEIADRLSQHVKTIRRVLRRLRTNLEPASVESDPP